MEDSGYSLSSQNTLLVLFVVGAIALAFIFILVFDALRRGKNRGRGRSSRGHREGNPISRFLKRTRQNIEGLKGELRNRARHKARTRDRRH